MGLDVCATLLRVTSVTVPSHSLWGHEGATMGPLTSHQKVETEDSGAGMHLKWFLYDKAFSNISKHMAFHQEVKVIGTEILS